MATFRPEGQALPYIIVQALGVPAHSVRFTLFTSANPQGEARVLPWNPHDFATRRSLGDAIRELAPALSR